MVDARPVPVVEKATAESTGGDPPAAPPLAVWDEAEARAALHRLRTAIRTAEVRAFGGRFPPVVASVMAAWVEVGESYIRDQERLRAAGWDPLSWLRTLPSAVGETIQNWHQIQGRRPEPGQGGER